ncbi:hypothetical protein BHM03_00033584 [Ensete ventricosum]|nr:hypothetical protein BHM03_00033584 [Ensete ventricosum]
MIRAVGVLQCSHSFKGTRQVRRQGRKQVVEMGEKATSPDGLNDPIVKETKEVENVETKSKYQDRAKGQRPWNFIRPVLTGFSLR